MSLNHTFAITIAFNERESETVHMVCKDENGPSEAEIRSLVEPYVRQVYHESGQFEIESIESVQESVTRLLEFSKS